ncbi:MAG: acetyl-CoA C-acetyltransferase [Pseudomonadota bacterium]
MNECYIYDHARTPRGRGKPTGGLHGVTAIDAVIQILQALRNRNNLDTDSVEDVILGVCEPYREQGANIARASVLGAGYAHSVAGIQVNSFCASGLDAMNIAAAKVMSGQTDLAVGGGVEMMGRVPMDGAGGSVSTDPTLTANIGSVLQGVAADALATIEGFVRRDVDAYAAESQRRAAQAWEEGRFDGAILPIRDVNGQIVLDKDEHLRPGTTVETLGNLKPSFPSFAERGFASVLLQRFPEMEAIDFVHHPGNSSGIVDGASGVLVGSKEAGERCGLKPRAVIRACGSIGSDPSLMLVGPEKITERLLKKTGMSVGDIDLFEVNEAFASVPLRYMRVFDLDSDIVNVNGGAIALGHPIGATGGMLLGTLVDELERADKEVGLVTLCAGLGLSTAAIVERAA